MSFLKERGENYGYDFKLGAREFSVKGALFALLESPGSNNFPPTFRIGTLGLGGNVTFKDGKSAHIEIEEDTPPLGSKVIVFEKAKSGYTTGSQ